jgi:hypothetical protein
MKKSGRVLLINLLSLGTGLLVLELLLGTWFFGDPMRTLNIPRNSETRYTIHSPYFPKKESLCVRDEWGLRGSFDDPGEISILTIGGSTTAQRYLSEGETWQDVLQRNFFAAGDQVVVGNAGLSGQSTFGHIKNFSLWLPRSPRLKPK